MKIIICSVINYAVVVCAKNYENGSIELFED